MELFRNIIRWQFIFAFFALTGLYIYGFEAFRQNLSQSYLYDNNFYSAFLYGLGAGGWSILPILFPLIVVLISGDSLAWDRKTRFIEYINVRISKKNYILHKIFISALTSILFVGAGSFISFLYCFFTFPKPIDLSKVLLNKPTYAFDLFISHPFLYVIALIINLCLIAIIVSSISLLVSVYVNNIYIVMASPFILFLIMQFISDSNPYSPINLTGIYVSVYAKYNLLEIPLLILIMWLILSVITFIVFTRKNKIEVV